MSFNLRAALEGVRGRGRLLIMTHDNPDPDSIACALGLQLVVAQVGVEATLGLGGIIGRAENRAMVRELGIELHPLETLTPADFQLLALCDAQPGGGNCTIFPGRQCDIVIDHHPRRSGSLGVPWCDIREDVGASSLIAYSYLRELGIPVDGRLATAFLYALKSETRDLGREAGEPERMAYLELFPLADPVKLYAITSPKLGREHFRAVDRALHAAEVRGSLVTASLGNLEYPDLVAEVADLLLDYDLAHWVLCMGEHRGTVFLSVRTDITDAHAGSLIRRVIGERGAGGGHGMIAGGRLRQLVHSPRELEVIYEDLVERFAAELRIKGPRRPLLA
jgi:nanoRNase/pAp phosphatase (c-di-AMP/oligoRNAs hydrolase)